MNKPDIRFNGFDEEWEEKNYKEVFDTSVSNNTFSRAELTSEKTSTKNVHYGDILIKYNSILSVKKDDFPFIPDNVKVDSKNFLKNGDIVFADTAEDETCGKAVEITDLENENVLAGLHTFVARPKLQFQEKYLGYFINSPAYHNQLVPYMQGTKVTSISKANVQKTSVKYPNKAEQTKIGNLFSQIDSLISSTQKELDKLVSLKKCMLQKMFPKKGCLVPEIRFEGFNGEWVEKKLEDCVEFLDSQRQPIEERNRITGPYPYYGASGIVDYVNGYIFDEELILLSEDGANITDRNYPVCFLARGKYWVNNHAHVLKANKQFDNDFLCNSLELKDYTQYNSGMAMPKLNKEVCLNIPLLCPDFDEQQKIGSYFQNLDNLISKQSQELEKLQNVKKTLLSKMFV